MDIENSIGARLERASNVHTIERGEPAPNLERMERTAVRQAVDEATKANEQPAAEVVAFQLSLEGRANLLTDLTGKAMQGLIAERQMFGTYGPLAATEAVRIAELTMYAIERKVGELFTASQGQARG